MNRIMSYLTGYAALLQWDTESTEYNSSLESNQFRSNGKTEPSASPPTISPLSSEYSSSPEHNRYRSHGETEPPASRSTTITSKLAPYSNEREMVRSIIGRAIKSEKVLLPTGWSNDWANWEYLDELSGPFERSDLQVWLELKHHLVFNDVELLMFEVDTEQMVFRYQCRYYRYLVESSKLFLYPDAEDPSPDVFLEYWDGIDGKEQLVEAKGTDKACHEITSDEYFEALHRTLDPEMVELLLRR
ncbi:hypothetical protein C8J56DRAFT_969835 [Mycena floridula]|nr:hypothetical protein C8J56DRAFT_969835 [Mycena floridula]